MKSIIFLLFLFASVTLGATDQPAFDPDDDFAPGLGLFALFAIIVIFLLIGVGIVCAVLVLASTAVVVSLGVISSSAIIGFYRRRFSAGLRALFYQVCSVVTVPAGIGVLWFGSYLATIELRSSQILLIGAISGICSGLLLAFLIDQATGIVYRHFIIPRLTLTKFPNSTDKQMQAAD